MKYPKMRIAAAQDMKSRLAAAISQAKSRLTPKLILPKALTIIIRREVKQKLNTNLLLIKAF